MFGCKNPVQRYRNHKMKNVLEYLPEDLREQMKTTMKAAFQLEEKKGLARLNKLAGVAG